MKLVKEIRPCAFIELNGPVPIRNGAETVWHSWGNVAFEWTDEERRKQGLFLVRETTTPPGYRIRPGTTISYWRNEDGVVKMVADLEPESAPWPHELLPRPVGWDKCVHCQQARWLLWNGYVLASIVLTWKILAAKWKNRRS